MYGAFKAHLNGELEAIEAAGLFKHERGIAGPQGPEITVNDTQVLELLREQLPWPRRPPEHREGRAHGAR